jgi:glycosyltransferase involved in cell wall biosynthesis
MMHSGAVSVCIPVLNGERFLAEAVLSIVAQTHALAEIVICDDFSTDDTPRIAAGLAARDNRIRVLRPPPTIGRAFSVLNWGIRQTISEFVAVYHADDVYDRNIVEREAAYLTAHPEAGAVFCLPRFLDENGRVTGKGSVPSELRGVDTIDCRTLTEAILRHKNVVLSAPSAMLRRTTFDLVGGFDQSGYGAQADGEMWLRIVRTAPIGLLHEHLFGYRFHPAQWSRHLHNLRTVREPFFRMMEAHLSAPGVRQGVSAEALTEFRVWEAKDETERAANALVLGDTVKARAILRASLVRPLLRTSSRERVARILALKAIVYAAASLGGGSLVRKAVYAARFRRRMPEIEPFAEDVLWALPTDTASSGPGTEKKKAARSIRVFLDPPSYHFLGNGLFDSQSKWNRDGSLRPWLLLRSCAGERGISIDTADYLETSPSTLGVRLYSSFGIHDRLREVARRKNILFNSFYLFETVMYDPEMYRKLPQLSDVFQSVYSWTDEKTLARFTNGSFRVKQFRYPSPYSDVIDNYWSREDRKGVILACTNRRGAPMDGDLFGERLNAIRHFSDAGDFELWGRRWDAASSLPPEVRGAVSKSWRGVLADKYAAYSRSRFVVCYENQILPGWITEKIFDCFRTGAIPLYLGAPDITRWIPEDCFIDVRKFDGYANLDRFMNDLGPRELYNYRLAARDFFASDSFKPFSAEFFAERFVEDVIHQANGTDARGNKF